MQLYSISTIGVVGFIAYIHTICEKSEETGIYNLGLWYFPRFSSDVQRKNKSPWRENSIYAQAVLMQQALSHIKYRPPKREVL